MPFLPPPPPRRFPANMPSLPVAVRGEATPPLDGRPPPLPARGFPPNMPPLPVAARQEAAPSLDGRRPPPIALAVLAADVAPTEPPAPAMPPAEVAPAEPPAPAAPRVPAMPVLCAPVPVANPGRDAKVVVLAEDDPETRQLLVQSLGRQYRVFEAADGQAVLELLARIARPAVVILDINMPRIDGLGVAAEIKGTPQLKDVPIIFLTCLDAPLDVVRGIQAGARNYITKPFAISKLMEKVAKASGQVS
jgi:CheY-like chemotaxis protein